MSLLSSLLTSCSSLNFQKTVSQVDIPKFMGKWYVIAGRFYLSRGRGHNSIEIYKWNKKEQRIDIEFYFNKDSFDGKVKEIPPKGIGFTIKRPRLLESQSFLAF